MLMDIKKFNKEISALKFLEAGDVSLLHPLIRENTKHRVLSSILTEPQDAPKSFVWQEKKAGILKYLVSSILGFSLLAGTAFAANNSKPGDALFPLKKVEEKIALSLALSEPAKTVLEVKFADRRLKELNQIQAQIQTDQIANVISGNAASTEKRTQNSHKKAEIQAQAEVSNAINTLTRVQLKLDAKNNQQAASSVETTLLRLKASETLFKATTKTPRGK